jgi:hypothetical protein
LPLAALPEDDKAASGSPESMGHEKEISWTRRRITTASKEVKRHFFDSLSPRPL